jgi:hypothetical protein
MLPLYQPHRVAQHSHRSTSGKRLGELLATFAIACPPLHMQVHCSHSFPAREDADANFTVVGGSYITPTAESHAYMNGHPFHKAVSPTV